MEKKNCTRFGLLKLTGFQKKGNLWSTLGVTRIMALKIDSQ